MTRKLVTVSLNNTHGRRNLKLRAIRHAQRYPQDGQSESMEDR